MGTNKNKKKKSEETSGLQPKGGAYAIQDSKVAAEGLNAEMLGEGLITKEEIKAAKRAKKEADKVEVAKAKEKSQKAKEEKKKKGGLVKGFRDMLGELRKVRWPSLSQTFKQTGVVLTVVVLFGLVVFGIDRGLGALYELLMKSVTKS